MKAMILAAGRGSRMNELTSEIPKPLVPLAGKPIVTYVIDALKKAGVTELVVNTSYQAQKLEAFLQEYNPGLSLKISREEERLDTGGGIFKAREYLQDAEYFLVHNADVYSEIDLLSLFKSHIESEALATLAVQERTSSRLLLFSKELDFKGWHNKEGDRKHLIEGYQVEDCIGYGFTGVQVLSKKIFDVFENLNEEKFSIITAYVEAVAEGLPVKAFDCSASAWFDIGTPEKLQKAEEFIQESAALSN